MKRATRPLLIEIGVEEMPAGVSGTLLTALSTELGSLLRAHDIDAGPLRKGCTPRRLLLHWTDCPLHQPDRDEVLWGPPETAAYREGQPTPAAEGFARKAGIALADCTLEDKGDGKACYLKAVVHRPGRPVTEILAEALPGILKKLPSPKQMRWQDGEGRSDAFIRPVRWIVARLGGEVIPFTFAGVQSGKTSFGHRILGGNKGVLDLRDPFAWLERKHVQANHETRRRRITERMERIADKVDLQIHADVELLDEVTDLTEWPVPVLCTFREDYLRLPEQLIRIVLKQHQRCFITYDRRSGRISNRFLAVANIASTDEAQVAGGNARVVNARLADAAFYFDRDPQESLEARVERLNQIVFQDGLGTVGDQVMRLRSFVLDNALQLGADPQAAQRAAYLCKSDLTTGVVAEFPELQGYMGAIYAAQDGEPEAVQAAIAEHYRPVGADDALPENAEARAIAIAERLDKLLGYFHLGRIPSASADPFGLRRAAITLIRLLADGVQPATASLPVLLQQAAKQWNQQRITTSIPGNVQKQTYLFIIERLLGLAAELDCSRHAIEAALTSSTQRPLHQVIEVARLLTGFADSETGQAVAAANKRIANILKQAESGEHAVKAHLFEHEAEKHLFAALIKAENAIDATTDPEQMLATLATLRQPVDQFFDDVMVMCEDKTVRDNRLALLTRLRTLFLTLADVSRLG
jgi:glycyl-tRNA synthetase beta chain